MLYYTGLLFLGFAVSLDGFGVGITYGIRRVRVPLTALLIIMMISGITVLLSMTIGSMLSQFIQPDIAGAIGGCILVGLGLFSLVNMLRSRGAAREAEMDPPEKFHVFKNVMKTPEGADIDRSGIISAKEALLLGIALALDAFGAGLGASIIGYDPVLTTIVITAMSGLFVFCGITIGMLLSNNKRIRGLTFIAPLLLMALGVFNIFK